MGATILAVAASVLTAATPSPSPSLESGLVAPTETGFVEASASDGFLDGPVTAGEWSGDDVRMLDLLRRDHFVSGFARSFVDSKAKRFVFEAAAAFRGQSDATNFLAYYQASPTDAGYSRAIVLSEIDTFVGAHFADPKKPSYWDEGVFTKGNDVYIVYCEAQTDTLGDMCPSLARRQFAAAPQFTIPPSLWPENASRNVSSASSSGPGGLLLPIAVAVTAILIAGALALVVTIVLLARRRVAPAARIAEPAPAGGPQMSADGRYWWDGQAWRDAEQDVPAGATRSPDGYYWWDGRSWRLAPRPAGAA